MPLIRSIEYGDVECVLAIQRSCPEVAQWSAEDYSRVANGEMAGWVVAEDRTHRRVSDRTAHRERHRDFEPRSGCGITTPRHWRFAVAAFARVGQARFEAENAILEVRASNLAGACSSTSGTDLKVLRGGCDTTSNPADDALVLSKPLAGAKALEDDNLISDFFIGGAPRIVIVISACKRL